MSVLHVPSGTMNQHPTAIVLNVGSAGLGAVRSLGRAGVPVVGLDPDSSHSGFVSKYCDAKQSPHPVHEPDQLLDALIAEGERLSDQAVLSPASDAFLLFLSRYREQLRESFRFILPPPDVAEAAVDKRKLYELTARVGFDHAATHYPQSMEEVHRIKHDLDYPVFIKPYYSHMWQIHFPGTGKGIKAFTAEELVSWFERILPSGVDVMVQSIIKGPASNVRTVYTYIAEDGSPLGVLTTRKIRQYPAEFGRGSLAETFHDQEFADYGLKFFQAIGYRGFGTIEFKLDDRDGKLKVTDLNPRWVGPTALPIAAGINFPLMHYLDLIGQAPQPQMEFTAGVRWLNAMSDFASAWPLVRSRQLSPLALGRSWLGARSFPVFARDDLRPFFQEVDYGRKLLRAPLHMWRER